MADIRTPRLLPPLFCVQPPLVWTATIAPVSSSRTPEPELPPSVSTLP